MKINALTIRGFRSLRDVVWEPGNLNVVIGPNASGKTNLLRALDLLKQANAGNLEQTILRLGGMLQLCWNGFASGGIEWHLQSEAVGMEALTAASHELTYELVLGGSDFSGLG